ncbi:AIPR family protein [Glutamicibacter arilaitensis]|uniref:AIPR family protein n=1 Tax=Glutamicibacter arilaitensis TaxID=256701 RepID=UPI003FD38E7B
MLARNVRVFLGDSEVNKSIKETALTAPEQFWYLNNGITVLCRSFDKSVAGGSDRRHGNYVIRGASVVNGLFRIESVAT